MRYPDNARVVFIGDSMTHANQVLAHVVNHYKRNFPNSNIKFFNCGTAGASVGFALKVFDEDILPYNPTHAVVAFGINDSRRTIMENPRGKECYEVPKEAFETYKKNLKILCDKLSEKNIKITVCTPPPYDEYQKCDTPALRGMYAVMVEYSHFVRKFTAQNGYNCCDYNDYLTNLINFENLFAVDRVHPNEHGYYRMAECFLKQQGLCICEEEALPEYLLEWHAAVQKLRDIYAGENCIIKAENFHLSQEEKYELLNKYIEDNSAPKAELTPEQDYLLFLAREYIKNRPNLEQYKGKILEIYEKDILNGDK